MALLGAMTTQAASFTNLGDIHKMYQDPEYADTWRWTDDPRYVTDDEYDAATPKEYFFLQTQHKHKHRHRSNPISNQAQ